MPIGNITQTMSTILSPPHRGVDVQTVFVSKQEDFQDHLADITIGELNTLKDQLNSRIGEINSTATTINEYANTASAGASTATTKAGEASTSATAALTSKNQASTFATNSSNSATKASQWADNNYNVEVETGKYSAKHWSTVAQNATANKVDKVTSTDNAIVRFNGTNGEVKSSLVTIDDGGNIRSVRVICAGTGNDYNTGAIEANGNGSTVVPSIGFHQPGVYGGSLQQVAGNEFSFHNHSGAYAVLKNNINMQNAINVNGTVGGSILTSNVIVESGSNANGSYTKFANGSMMEYKIVICAATANVLYYEPITWPVSGASGGTGAIVTTMSTTFNYIMSQSPSFNGFNFFFRVDTTQTYYFTLTKYTP